MKLIELIIDILDKNSKPLRQSEILALAKVHENFVLCEELNRVKVPLSAIARTLSKYTVGTTPPIGIYNGENDNSSFKRFYLRNKKYDGIKILSEIELHPYLVTFANIRFNIYCKTINASKTKGTKSKVRKWTNPDIVGVNPVILDLNNLFQKEIEKLGLFSTKVLEFYSFELKVKLDKSNITDAYFQAVSNSSWANYGYLVVEDFENSRRFLDTLYRLNNAYGIGLIKLNINDPSHSEVVISARFKEVADINFMNFLSSTNNDFHSFINSCIEIVKYKKINLADFDKIN